MDYNIPSWVFWRKLNLSDGFDSFQFLKFLNLKRYVIENGLAKTIYINFVDEYFRNYFWKSLQCLKIISTSWILNRSVGRICRMDVFYYYICRSSNISQTKFFNWRQYGDFIFLCFICFPFTSWSLNKVEKKTSVRQIFRYFKS